MEINRCNQAIMDKVVSSISNDVEESISQLKTIYGSLQDDISLKTIKRIEIFIFRLYDYKYFVKDTAHINVNQYVTDDNYYWDTQNQIKSVLNEEQGFRLYEDAMKYIQVQDYSKAGDIFFDSALCGNVEAQYDYGVTLANGEGREADLFQSCYWYWKAANQDNSKAMLNLGIAYRTGQGVKADGYQMLYLYAAAAEMLLPQAVYNFGLSLKYEEVLGGNASTGFQLIDCSDNMNSTNAKEYVCSIAKSVKELLAEKTDIYTI